jgi:hypothetical protein
MQRKVSVFLKINIPWLKILSFTTVNKGLR